MFFFWRINNLRRLFLSFHQYRSVSLTSRSLICMKVMKAISKKGCGSNAPYSLVVRWPQSEHLFLFPYWINTPGTWVTRTTCYHFVTTGNGDMSKSFHWKRTFLPETHILNTFSSHSLCVGSVHQPHQRTNKEEPDGKKLNYFSSRNGDQYQ